MNLCALQDGANRGRKLKRAEMFESRYNRKLQAGYRQLMVEEAERMEDIVKSLGQALENKGLWLHPDDRADPPPRQCHACSTSHCMRCG